MTLSEIRYNIIIKHVPGKCTYEFDFMLIEKPRHSLNIHCMPIERSTEMNSLFFWNGVIAKLNCNSGMLISLSYRNLKIRLFMDLIYDQ